MKDLPTANFTMEHTKIVPLHKDNPQHIDFSEVEAVKYGEELIKVSFGGASELELHIPKGDIGALRDALNKIGEEL